MEKDWKLVFRKREKDDDLFKDKKDEEFLTILIEMFDRWDKEVQAERERQKTKGYFSDALENELKEFAESCVYWCVRKYDAPGFPSQDEGGWKTLYSYLQEKYKNDAFRRSISNS